MSLVSSEAPTHVKKVNLTKTESVEWEFEIEVGSNKVQASLSYTDDFDSWLTRCPELESNHPDLTALALKKIKGVRQEGGMVKVTLFYECNDPDVKYPGRAGGVIKRYGMEPSVGEEPLLTNHLFKDLVDSEKEAIQSLIGSPKSAADFSTAIAAVTSDAGKKAIAKVRRGTEAYLNPGVVWVERFTTKNIDDLKLDKILTTTSNPPGGCPSAGSERNWLYLSGPANPHEDGKFWDVELKWQLSERGKWDPDFYSAG